MSFCTPDQTTCQECARLKKAIRLYVVYGVKDSLNVLLDEVAGTDVKEESLVDQIQEHFAIDQTNADWFTHTTEIVSTLRDSKGADVNGSERALSMQLSSTLKRLGLIRTKKNNRWGYIGITVQHSDSSKEVIAA